MIKKRKNKTTILDAAFYFIKRRKEKKKTNKYFSMVGKIGIVLLLTFIFSINARALAEVTFGTNVRVDDTGSSTSDQRDPSIATDPNGNIYVAWADNRDDSSGDIYLAKSTDGGNSFETNVRVDDTGLSTGAQHYPSIVIDTNGNIYVVWIDYRNGNSDIYFAKSTDGGNSFETNVRVDDTGSSIVEQLNPSIATDQNGNIYIVWQDNRNGSYDTYFAKGAELSSDGPSMVSFLIALLITLLLLLE